MTKSKIDNIISLLKRKEEKQMELGKKLKIAMLELDIKQTELAKRSGQTQGNISQKINADNFSFREYERLVKALNCELEVTIILPNGKRI